MESFQTIQFNWYNLNIYKVRMRISSERKITINVNTARLSNPCQRRHAKRKSEIFQLNWNGTQHHSCGIRIKQCRRETSFKDVTPASSTRHLWSLSYAFCTRCALFSLPFKKFFFVVVIQQLFLHVLWCVFFFRFHFVFICVLLALRV